MGQALYSFNGKDYGNDYLSFAQGERIVLVAREEDGEGWVFGGRVVVGWLPKDFLDMYPRTAEPDAAVGDAEIEAMTCSGPSCTEPRLGKTVDAFEGKDYGVDYISFEKGDLVVRVPHEENDEDWVFGVLIAEVGWLPEHFWHSTLEVPELPQLLELPSKLWAVLVDAHPSSMRSTLPVAAEMGKSFKGEDDVARRGRTIHLGQALYSFNGNDYGNDYLSFAQGEGIVLAAREEDGEGWLFGGRVVVGWLPNDFFEDGGA